MKNRIRTDEATISANIRLDKRRERAKNTYPTKLEVYFKGAKKRYDLRTYFSQEDWEKVYSPKLKDKDLLKLKTKIEKEKARAYDIIESLKEDFSFANFEALFLNKPIKKKSSQVDVHAFFEKHTLLLKSKKQIGYAESFASSASAFKLYSPNLTFKSITPTFLTEFENWMLSKEKSITTIGIYMRNLRVIFNLAIEDNVAKKEDYPFGSQKKKKYEIPTGRNIKKALSEDSIKKIAQYDPTSKDEERARDLWLFSFICNGMNMTDICHLKHENIDEDFFYFIRQKTSGKQRDKKPIEVFITNKAKLIIKKWGNKIKEKDEYIFPILQKGQSIEEQHRIVKNLTRSINHYMNKIGEDLGFTIKGTYSARHSYSTILRDRGVNVSEISENLGHTTITTTTNYLARFNQDKKKKTASIINKIIGV